MMVTPEKIQEHIDAALEQREQIRQRLLSLSAEDTLTALPQRVDLMHAQSRLLGRLDGLLMALYENTEILRESPIDSFWHGLLLAPNYCDLQTFSSCNHLCYML
jgi:hypothetical protein